MIYYFRANITYFRGNKEHKLSPKQHYYFLDPHEEISTLYAEHGDNDKYFKKGFWRKLGLARYLDEDSKIYKKVKSIDYKIDEGQCIFTVVSGTLTEQEKKELIEYLEGQIGDGWGENGFYIQRHIVDTPKYVYVETDVTECFFISVPGKKTKYWSSIEEAMKLIHKAIERRSKTNGN